MLYKTNLRYYILVTIACLKALEQKEEITLKKNIWQKIVKLRPEINNIEIEKKKHLEKESMKQRVASLRKSVITN